MNLNEALKELKKAGYIVEWLSAIHPSQLLDSEKDFSRFADDLNKNVFPYEEWEYEVDAFNNPKHLQSLYPNQDGTSPLQAHRPL